MVFRREFFRPSKFFEDFFGEIFPEVSPGRTFNLNQPSLNILEHNDSYEFILDVPGLEKKDIQIEIQNNILIVKSDVSISELTANCVYKERDYGPFVRQIQIPGDVETNDIKATLEKGILKIILMKKPSERVKRIEIEDEKDIIDITENSNVK
ncbi:MAG: Hsp20/alpha crystallin family protein [Candidatus Helarchaeota archaeon]